MIALLLAAAMPRPGRADVDTPPQVAEATQRLAVLLQGEGELRLAGRPVDRSLLTTLYEKHGFQPIWEGEREAALLRVLAAAETHGLDAAAYAVPEAAPDQRDLLLTDAFLRYAQALAKGRVAPAEIETDWAIPAPALDAAALFERALAGDMEAVLAGLAPSDPRYDRLRQALAQYRDLAAAGGWRAVPGAATLKLGDDGEPVELLRRRLAAEGYLPAAEGSAFDAEVEDAVKRFQAQHGVIADGEVGRGTLAALNVPVAARIRQIRLNLERWHSLPRDWAGTRIEVNVTGATATLFEGGEPALAMRAIVGAPDHPTPVLRARMVAMLINPPWNVPSSIIEKEIRPALKRDPHYLERNEYVYVERNGGRQLQQMPGPKNALGHLKFEMPNIYDVYLHDTPSRPLFGRSKRALSHGCVRLEQPRQLAERLMGSAPDWTLEAIDQAIAAGDTQRVALPHSLPVYILYWTAFVDADGTVQFRDDVYGRDKRLAVALAEREAQRTAALKETAVPSVRVGG